MTVLFDPKERNPFLELLFIILIAAIVALLLTFVVGNLPAFAQTKIGPWVGLRLPVYDYSCKCYRYFKLNPAQSQIDPDPAGTSDGIWSAKILGAPGTNPIRQYGVRLTAVGASYPLPPAVSNVVVYVNGLRYSSPDDYTLRAGVIVPACTAGPATCNWPPGSPVVLADFDSSETIVPMP